MLFRLVFFVSAVGAVVLSPAPAITNEVQAIPPADIDFFEKHIRPLLADRCWDCHSEEVQESNLRLDSLQAMLQGGERGPAVVPGDAKASLLIHAVNHSVELQMPEGEKLSAREIKSLIRWIDSGARWPGAAPIVQRQKSMADGPLFTDEEKRFWAFRPPRLPKPPEVSHEAWIQSDLDRFILKKLEMDGLHPAPAASKSALIRRAYFDLIGLPPEPAQVQMFLDDNSPEAFAKVVDKLLASPQYGERWGRHWLDVARYADSNGLDENVAFEYIYKYRDWVIESLNHDLPYDQFVTHQIAGDLITQQPHETADDYIHRVKAIGFLAVGPKMVADDDPMKKEMDVIDEQLSTLSQTFMALTVGCARCHDHKFDPIPTWDYYAMAGIFKSVRTLEHLGVVAPIVNRELKPTGYDQRLKVYQEKSDKLNRQRDAMLQDGADPVLDTARDELSEYVRATSYYGLFCRPDPTVDLVWEAEDSVSENLEKKQLGEITVIQGRSFPKYDFTIAQPGRYQLYLRFANKEKRSFKIMADGKDTRQTGGFLATGGRESKHLRWMRQAILEFEKGSHTLQFERIQGVLDKVALVRCPDTCEAEKILVPDKLAEERNLDKTLLAQWIEYVTGVDDLGGSVWSPLVNLSLSRSDDSGSDFQQALARLHSAFQAARQDRENDALVSYHNVLFGDQGPYRLPADSERWIRADQKPAWKDLQQRLTALKDTKPMIEHIMGVKESKPEDLRVMLRGNYLTLGEPTKRQFLRIIDGARSRPIDTDQSGRLELARWVTRPDHPLTARVIVNRVWRWRFGRGIVSTTDNFGRLGERPSHPDLLDWLAAVFVNEDGWSLKRLHRRMMLSATYQMSTTHDALADTVDPTNQLWWRFPRQRLEAEAIRDAVLSVSRNLDRQMGGTLMPHRDKAYVTGTASKTQNYDNPRRSVYQPVYRSAVYDVFTAFDFPDPATACGDRQSSVVAPQALLMMNSPLVETSTRRLAERLLLEHNTDVARLDALYWAALARAPRADEAEIILMRLSSLQDSWTKSPAADLTKVQQQVWQSICRAVIASNEFIYLD